MRISRFQIQKTTEGEFGIFTTSECEKSDALTMMVKYSGHFPNEDFRLMDIGGIDAEMVAFIAGQKNA